MDCFFVREHIGSRQIQTYLINTKEQVADLFTKPLGTDRYSYLLNKLGIRNIHAPT